MWACWVANLQCCDTTSCDRYHEPGNFTDATMKCDPLQGIPAHQHSLQLEIQCAESSKYLISNHPISYNPSESELRLAQAATLPPSPPTVRQNVPYTEPKPLDASLSNHACHTIANRPVGQRLKARSLIRFSQSKKSPRKMASRKILRSNSRHLAGSSMGGREARSVY